MSFSLTYDIYFTISLYRHYFHPQTFMFLESIRDDFVFQNNYAFLFSPQLSLWMRQGSNLYLVLTLHVFPCLLVCLQINLTPRTQLTIDFYFLLLTLGALSLSLTFSFQLTSLLILITPSPDPLLLNPIIFLLMYHSCNPLYTLSTTQL